ncbi:MAG: putative ABC transporter permease [Butyrivibrio sp.]|nr:putative ABC transporter permease [Butyrivibrio sp.]
MLFARYYVLFMIFSFIGWIYECTYCTIDNKKWSNRGFLYGPICPIYGFGTIACVIIFGHLSPDAYHTVWWKIFLICAIGSAIMEYSTSYILEKLFNAVWWDYSNIPLNINGRISIPTTFAFGVAGIIVVRFILPFFNLIPLEQYPLLTELVAMILIGFTGADLALTVASLTELIQKMDSIEDAFNQKLEAGVEIAQGGPVAIGSHLKTAFSNSVKEKTDAFTIYVREYATKMNRHEEYHMRSIRKFKRNYKSSIALRLKLALDQLGKKNCDKTGTEG